MLKCESNVQEGQHSAEFIYERVSNPLNMDKLRQAISSDDVEQKLQDIDPQRAAQLKDALDKVEFTEDAIVMKSPLGSIKMQIVEREQPKLVKFQSAEGPLPLTMWIQLLPQTDTTCKVRVTVGAEVNMMMKPMLSSPLTNVANVIAQFVAALP